jgi:hypothetical protein
MESQVSPEVLSFLQKSFDQMKSEESFVSYDPTYLFKDPGMSPSDALFEIIMNIYDLLVDDPNRKIDFHTWVETKGDKQIAINFRDNGPAFENGVDNIKNILFKIGAHNKDGNEDYVGEAGVGAKEAMAALGTRWEVTWSPGGGNPINKVILDEKTTGKDNNNVEKIGMDENEELGRSNESFFHIRVSNLRRQITNPSKMHDRIAKKFQTKMKDHGNNVRIFTCQPEKKNAKPVQPIGDPLFVIGEGFDPISNYIKFKGITIAYKLGYLQKDQEMYSAPSGPYFVIERAGVKLIDTCMVAENVQNMLIKGVSGGKHHLRQAYISIDCIKIQPAKIKNNINDQDELTVSILEAVGNDKNVRKWLSQVRIYNSQNTPSETVISEERLKRQQKVLDKMTSILQEQFKDTGLNIQLGNSFSSVPVGAKPTKRYLKNNKKNAANKKPVQNNSSSLSVGGKTYPLIVRHSRFGDGTERFGWRTTKEGFVIEINEDWSGLDTETLRGSKRTREQNVEYTNVIADFYSEFALRNIINEEGNVSLESIEEVRTNKSKVLSTLYG